MLASQPPTDFHAHDDIATQIAEPPPLPYESDLVATPEPAVVSVMSGPARGTDSEVHQSCVVGAGPDADLRLADAKLADMHCEVLRDGAGWTLRDLGSDAGTVINGRPVQEVALKGGEVIMVGRTVLRFKVPVE